MESLGLSERDMALYGLTAGCSIVNCPVADKRCGAGPLNELFHKNARLNGSFFLATVELVVV